MAKSNKHQSAKQGHLHDHDHDHCEHHEHPSTHHSGRATIHPLTRREFLHNGLVMASTAAIVPAFLQRSAFAAAAQQPDQPVGAKPGVDEDRVLVIVELGGGNDGLNTVIPYGDDNYYRARPGIAIPAAQALRIDGSSRNGLGLHPNMTDMQSLANDGRMGVVLGAGYPNPNRSHFVSMDIWHTADPSGGRGLGWVGQSLDQKIQAYPNADHSTACIAIGNSVPLATQGKNAKALTFQNERLFQWVGGELHPELGRQYQKLNRTGNHIASTAGGNLDPVSSEASFLMRTSLDAQVASDRIRSAVAAGTLTSFPGGDLANQLRLVSAMIRANMPTRVYYTRLGGFDTHANQPNGHGQRLQQFSQAMGAFYRELDELGASDRVLTVAFSEFGRRVAQNASNGTDHGTAGPMFLFGPMARPGWLGQQPNLTKLDQGDLIHTVDFRSIYASILTDWLGVEQDRVLGQAFQPANVLNL